MTFPIALMFIGAALWPVTLVVAGLFVALAFVVRARWARGLCWVVAAALVVDMLGGLALVSATTYQ